MKKNIIAIAALMALVIWGIYGLNNHNQAGSTTSVEAGKQSDVKVGLKQGEMAPDFKLSTIDGKTVQLSDFRGKQVLLNFWATWCPPCRAEMPHMVKFYNDYKDKNVVILSVNMTQSERNESSVPAFIQEYKMTFPIVLDRQGAVGDLYQVTAYPTSYLIDSQGVIRNVFVGAINYDTMVQSVSSLK